MANPRNFVSTGPIELDKLSTLEEFRRACARQRVRDKLRTDCPECRAYVLHDVCCCTCGAPLPNVPQPLKPVHLLLSQD